MHRQNGTSGFDQDHYSSSAKFPAWHTAVIEWKPNFCRFILDGNIIGTSTRCRCEYHGEIVADSGQGYVKRGWCAWRPSEILMQNWSLTTNSGEPLDI
jgi:hypothetical protein